MLKNFNLSAKLKEENIKFKLEIQLFYISKEFKII